MIVGLISDTHGLMRPEALKALAGSDVILHGGDIGGPAVLDALGTIAPVIAVRGNNDRERWAKAVPEIVVKTLGGVKVCMIHQLGELTLDPAREGIAVVVSGHSHKPVVERRGGVLYVNPGSAGPRRFSLPIAVGRLRLGRGAPRATIRKLIPSAVGCASKTASASSPAAPRASAASTRSGSSRKVRG